MPHSARKHSKGLDPGNPLVFDVRDLGPGAARTLSRCAPAPEYLGVQMARIPPGSELDLDLQFEGVTEGVLVTANVAAQIAGECGRCLEPFSSVTKVRFQELYAFPSHVDQADGEDSYAIDSYRLDGSGLLDLEPALRDAIVLELPLSPLCEDGCLGLCQECGVRLADAEPGHRHERRGPMWAALADFRAAEPGDRQPGDEVTDPATEPAEKSDRTNVAPGRAKEH